MYSLIHGYGQYHRLRNSTDPFFSPIQMFEKEEELKEACGIMHAFLNATPRAIGVSATQLAINLPVMAIRSEEGGIKMCINPIITEEDVSTYSVQEGSINFPSIICPNVFRKLSVKVSYYAFNHKLELKKYQANLGKLEGGVFQNILDHLHGVTIFDIAHPVPPESVKPFTPIYRIKLGEERIDSFIEGENRLFMSDLIISPAEYPDKECIGFKFNLNQK